jgi:hypothetical protein
VDAVDLLVESGALVDEVTTTGATRCEHFWISFIDNILYVSDMEVYRFRYGSVYAYIYGPHLFGRVIYNINIPLERKNKTGANKVCILRHSLVI